MGENEVYEVRFRSVNSKGQKDEYIHDEKNMMQVARLLMLYRTKKDYQLVDVNITKKLLLV